MFVSETHRKISGTILEKLEEVDDELREDEKSAGKKISEKKNQYLNHVMNCLKHLSYKEEPSGN